MQSYIRAAVRFLRVAASAAAAAAVVAAINQAAGPPPEGINEIGWALLTPGFAALDKLLRSEGVY